MGPRQLHGELSSQTDCRQITTPLPKSCSLSHTPASALKPTGEYGQMNWETQHMLTWFLQTYTIPGIN